MLKQRLILSLIITMNKIGHTQTSNNRGMARKLRPSKRWNAVRPCQQLHVIWKEKANVVKY